MQVSRSLDEMQVSNVGGEEIVDAFHHGVEIVGFLLIGRIDEAATDRQEHVGIAEVVQGGESLVLSTLLVVRIGDHLGRQLCYHVSHALCEGEVGWDWGWISGVHCAIDFLGRVVDAVGAVEVGAGVVQVSHRSSPLLRRSLSRFVVECKHGMLPFARTHSVGAGGHSVERTVVAGGRADLQRVRIPWTWVRA